MRYALQGFLIGFAIAAPVGPIGVLCIRRTLAGGRLIGFLSGLGAATADTCHGAVAAFGLTAVRDLLISQQSWLRLLGGAFLLVLAFRTFIATPATQASAPVAASRLSAYLTTLGLTLTNPATILSFAAVFTGTRLASSQLDVASASALVAGVFTGSAAWWLTLSSLVGVVRERFTPAWMRWVNRGAGLAIAAFGIVALIPG